jgi:16S rRNA (guanine527-N7)-methyltransferase
VRNDGSSSGEGGSSSERPQAAVSRETSQELIRQASALGVDLNGSQVSRLVRFEALLAERAVPLGAVARSDVGRIRERHVMDSLRAAPHVGSAGLVYDLGSGAGLPGIVVAVAVPDARMILIERRSRRAAFLELAVEELALPNVEVFAGTVEELTEPADAALARAFAPLDRAWAAAERLLRPGGRLVYFGGRGLCEWGAVDASDGAALEKVARTPVLESAGPLVIMTRQ